MCRETRRRPPGLSSWAGQGSTSWKTTVLRTGPSMQMASQAQVSISSTNFRFLLECYFMSEIPMQIVQCRTKWTNVTSGHVDSGLWASQRGVGISLRLVLCLPSADDVIVMSAGRTFDELSLPSLSLTKASSTSAQPPLALSEERVRAQNGRQLGYALSSMPKESPYCW